MGVLGLLGFWGLRFRVSRVLGFRVYSLEFWGFRVYRVLGLRAYNRV